MLNLKSRGVFASLGLLMFVASALAFAAQQPPPPPAPGQSPANQQPPGQGEPGRRPPFDRQGGPGGQQGPGGGRGANIEGSMKQIRRAMEQLTEQAGDSSKKDENLKLINDMQRGCVMAKGLPLPADRMKDAADDAAKAKLNESFHAEMRKSLRLMLDIEDDLVAGRADAAKAKLEQLQKLREDNHKTMGVKED